MSGKVRVRPTVADYERAAGEMYLPERWKELKARAQYAAATRLIEANGVATDKAMAKSKGLTGQAWLTNSDEITRLFDEHDQLLDIAFPESKASADGS